MPQTDKRWDDTLLEVAGATRRFARLALSLMLALPEGQGLRLTVAGQPADPAPAS